MTLIGDAAHPTLPYLGQGAAMAAEDGMILGTLLGRYAAQLHSRPRTSTNTAIAILLASYENLQTHRTATIVSCSALQGELNHLGPGPHRDQRDDDYAAFDPETTRSLSAWVDSVFNREVLGRDSYRVAMETFDRLQARGSI